MYPYSCNTCCSWSAAQYIRDWLSSWVIFVFFPDVKNRKCQFQGRFQPAVIKKDHVERPSYIFLRVFKKIYENLAWRSVCESRLFLCYVICHKKIIVHQKWAEWYFRSHIWRGRNWWYTCFFHSKMQRELIIYCTEETDDLDASHCSSYFLSLYREYFWTEINMPNLWKIHTVGT